MALTLGRLILNVTSTKLWSLIEGATTEQESARVGSVHITTSIIELVSVILVGSFTNCVKLKVAQSSFKVRVGFL